MSFHIFLYIPHFTCRMREIHISEFRELISHEGNLSFLFVMESPFYLPLGCCMWNLLLSLHKKKYITLEARERYNKWHRNWDNNLHFPNLFVSLLHFIVYPTVPIWTCIYSLIILSLIMLKYNLYLFSFSDYLYCR